MESLLFLVTEYHICFCPSESELAKVEKRRESDLLYDPDDELNELINLNDDDGASSFDPLADSHNDDDLLLELEEF